MKFMLAAHLTRILLAIAGASIAGAQSLALETVAEGLLQPNGVYSAPDDHSRLFVVSSFGVITVIEDGIVQAEPFLDIVPLLAPFRGLTSMAFHPDYASNGRFFVVYQASDMTSQVVEYSVSSDPNRADPASAKTLLGPVLQTSSQHVWNQLLFAPDGKLILGTGDGTDPGAPGNTAQDLGLLSGKILRLDVDVPAPHIPADNPFVGLSGAREEIWHYGVRQPWRMSFDAQTGDLFVSDVGLSSIEEVNILSANSLPARNLGWRCLEGDLCDPLVACIPSCGDSDWIQPSHTYPHTEGRCAIIGGFVYRGSAIPALQGRFLYADFCAGLYSLKYEGGILSDWIDHTAELVTPEGDPVSSVCSFGEDLDGELYIVSLAGSVFRIVDDVPVNSYCTTSPNSVGPGATIASMGSTSIAANDFVLTANGAVPGQFGLFFYGPTQAMQASGDGILCVGGGIQRLLPPAQGDLQGGHLRPLDLSALSSPSGTITAGSTWNFQLWYRDPAGPGGTGYNFTDGLQALFLP